MFKKAYPIVLAGLLGATPSFAAMPLVTDDTGTQGKGHVQIELGLERAHEKESERGVTTETTDWSPSATLTYGLSETIDLVAGFPWSWHNVEADGATVTDDKGVGDYSLQLKWRFLELQDGRLTVALKPGLTFPTGRESKGFGNGKLSGGVMLIATRSYESGAVHMNLGYNRNEYNLEDDRHTQRNDIWHASLAGERKLVDKLRAVADIGVDRNQEDGRDSNPAYILGGLIYSPSENVDLDFGVKGGLNDAEQATTLLAGATFRF